MIAATHKPSPLIDTRVVYCGDNLDQLRKLPDACVDLIYVDPPFNSNRNYEVFWGETREKRSFEDRHESTKAHIDYMRPRCVELDQTLQNFNGTNEKPRTAAADRAAQTTSLPTLIRDGSDLLGNQIDRLVNLFRRSNSQFVAGYRSARVIIDRPGTHAAPKKPTPAPQLVQPSPIGAGV